MEACEPGQGRKPAAIISHLFVRWVSHPTPGFCLEHFSHAAPQRPRGRRPRLGRPTRHRLAPARPPMSSSEPTTFRWRQSRTWAVAGLLLLAIAVIYGQTLSFPFLNYDDNAYVYECPPVREGLTADSIAWALTSGPFGEWYPTAMLSHMLDWQLYGSAAWGHHLTNLLLHAATAIGLFLVLRSMTGEFWPSAAVAAIFAVHPQHVENVAWIAERRDVLSGLFFVLTLAAYRGYAQGRPSIGWYLLVALMLSLGLMAKPTLVTVPPLLLVLDYWPLGRLGGARRFAAECACRPADARAADRGKVAAGRAVAAGLRDDACGPTTPTRTPPI